MAQPVPGATRAAASHLPDAEQAVAEVFRVLDPPTLAGAILFVSSRHDLDGVAAAVARRADGLTVIGCTSSGELGPDGLDEGSITALGFPRPGFRLDAVRFDALDEFDAAAAHAQVRALAATGREEGRKRGVPTHQAAIFLVDGLSHREELLTITLQDALGPVPMVGGSSGDGLQFRETFIYHDGAFRRDAALVAVLSSQRPLQAFRTQHCRPVGVRMVVTDADPVARVVREINAEPAAVEYARLTGMRVEELGPELFALRPLLVRAGGEYFVRAIQSANPDGSLTFYCAIDKGIVLTLGEETDQLDGLTELFDRIRADLGTVDRILGFHCVLNRLVAEQRQQTRALSRLLAGAQVTGFNSYGEQYHALHVNQTFTGLAIAG